MLKVLFVPIIVLVSSLTVMSESVLILSDEWPQMEVLEKFLKKEGGFKADKVEQDNLPVKMSSYHAVLMFIHGKMEQETGERLVDYTKNGGRLMVMHHGISSRKQEVPVYVDLLGVHLPSKDEEPDNFYSWRHDVDYFIVNLQPNHYITSHKVNWPAKTLYTSSDSPSRPVYYPAWENKNSEIFINHNFKDGREKTVLLGFKAIHPDTGKLYMQDRAGWYKKTGKGWVFYLQPGHTVEEYQNRNYCQMILNCLEWNPSSN